MEASIPVAIAEGLPRPPREDIEEGEDTVNYFTTEQLTMKKMQEHCHKLIDSKGIEKEAALGILQLQHGMQTMLMLEEHNKEKEVEALKNQLQIVHITNKSAEMLQSVCSDCSALRKSIEDIHAQLLSLSERVLAFETSLSLQQQQSYKRK